MAAALLGDGGDLRWRTRAFGGEALGAVAGAALWGGAFRGGVLWSGALEVAAPLSGRLPVPRVVRLLVVITSP